MSAFTDGVTIALNAGYEQHHRWGEYWKAIQPWAWFYIGFNALDVIVYPFGNPSQIMAFLWMLLYLGLAIVMWWNWQNQLLGRKHSVTWQSGWDDPDFRQYAGVISFVMIMPFIGTILLALPLALVLAVLGMVSGPLASLIQSVMVMALMAVLLYLFSRLLVLPAVLVAGITPPLLEAWQLTKTRWQAALSAFAVFFICSLICFFMLAALYNLFLGFGFSSAGLIMLPFQLSVGFFTMGWLVLLGQRLFDYLRSGHA